MRAIGQVDNTPFFFFFFFLGGGGGERGLLHLNEFLLMH